MTKASSKIKTVGITGASGNIGTTLSDGLAEKYQLTLYDIREAPKSAKGRFMKVDCAKREELKGSFEGLDAIIHLAGDPRPNAPRQLTLRNNFVGTSYVFEEAMRAGIKKIVYASSNFYHEGSIREALTGQLKKRITLDMPPTPQSLYGQSKVFGETIGLHLSYLGVQFAALRIGWTVPEDNPAVYASDYMQAVFISKRDLVQAFDKALNIDTDFLVAFAVSDNDSGVFDLTETKAKLGFRPQDNSEKYS